MPQQLSLLIFIAQSDKTFAPWRRIFQAEAWRRGARVSGQEGEGLVGKGGIARLLRPSSLRGRGQAHEVWTRRRNAVRSSPGRLRGHRAGPTPGSQRLGSH